ncbi:MAG: NAD(P)/FAD-dependent oxidoreductase [Candidatus Omnitrophica bacterium]|nr:NAD(P)/FAD-dependent oxidoreductase [Candidatus Omnitrophota bacterium]
MLGKHMQARPHIVIIGGGFAGLYAAQALKRADADVTLIDKRNFHLFQPLLYQVATGGLSPGDIASPLRAVLKSQMNCRVILGEVLDVDPDKKKIILRDDEIPYDYLIVSTGVRHSYFGNDQWEEWAPGLKTVEDATEIRRRILLAFEAAERETDPEIQQAWMNFVIVGAGPTGVELAGALAELARYTLKNNFTFIDPAEVNIMLIEGGDRVLPSYIPELSAKAHASLERLGVSIRTGAFVTGVDPHCVHVKEGDRQEAIPARTVLWAAGVQASPLGKILGDKTGAPIDRLGRVEVENDLSVPGRPEIMVIGDLASFKHQTGSPLPGVAPVAMQQGRYAARRLRAMIKGAPGQPFRYYNRGSMAVIGRAAAVADLRGMRFSGWPAWLIWLFVHIMYLVEFENRLLVFVQWAWDYFTRNRGARLITGQDLIMLKEKKEGRAGKKR